MRSKPTVRSSCLAFTFVEAVFTIAIIGIMAALAVSAISNGARDANKIVARQQQATVQEAVHAWVLSQTRVSNSAQIQSLSAIRATYNGIPSTSARFDKIKSNLDQVTVEHFQQNTVGTDKLKTAALIGAKQYLRLPDWQDDDMPRVELVDE